MSLFFMQNNAYILADVIDNIITLAYIKRKYINSRQIAQNVIASLYKNTCKCLRVV